MSDDPKGMRRGLTRYGDADFSLYLRKAFIKAMGYSDDALARPVIAIADTFSAYNACHATVPEIVAAVKRGVMLAGGLVTFWPDAREARRAVYRVAVRATRELETGHV